MGRGTDGCKIDIIVDRYDLAPAERGYDSFDEYLLARWTGAGDLPGDGYGTLADFTNRRLLKRVYEEQGRDTLAARLESEYDVLTGEDDLLKQELLDDLAADGIDGERLLESFVSRSTMRRHLNNCLDGEKEIQPARTDWERESVEIAMDRATEKTIQALRSLHSKGEFVSPESVDIAIGATVSCTECPTRLPLEEAIARGYVCAAHQDPPGAEPKD